MSASEKCVNLERLWIIVYSHRHGIDAWPVLSTNTPNLELIAAELDNWEPDRDEYLDAVSVYPGDIRDYDYA